MPPSPVLSSEAVQSPIRKHGCKKTHPAECSAMAYPLAGHVRSTKVWTVSDERASPRGYAFFMYPAWGDESPHGIAATFQQDGSIIANSTRNLLASKKFVRSPQVLRSHDLSRFIVSLTGNGHNGLLRPRHLSRRPRPLARYEVIKSPQRILRQSSLREDCPGAVSS